MDRPYGGSPSRGSVVDQDRRAAHSFVVRGLCAENRHEVDPATRKVTSTLQIGEPSAIAEITHIDTVGDFRVADVAGSGGGAPLMPIFDNLLLRPSKDETPDGYRVLQNIGGECAGADPSSGAGQPRRSADTCGCVGRRYIQLHLCGKSRICRRLHCFRLRSRQRAR